MPPLRRARLVRLALLGLFAIGATGCRASSAPGDTEPPSGQEPPPQPPAATVPVLDRSVVLSGLSNPWDLALTADGFLFWTERCRGLSVRRPDGTITRLFGTSGSALVAADLFCEGQSGMNGVALDPAFATNRTLYVYMASNRNSNLRSNRVVRLQVGAGYSAVGDRVDIITDAAFKHVGNAHGGSGAHSGGRLRFGPDGFLYVTTGDNHDGAIPQSPTVLGGKVLRVDGTGAAAPGNNAPREFDPRIYTYGHRNVQGIAFRPGTGQPFISEHGPNHSDEVTALVPGGNGGWDPRNRSGLSCAGGYCGYAGSPSTMPMTDLARFPGALRPSWQNNSASQGMGPATFLDGAQWKSWNGRLAVGFLRGQRLEILQLDAAGVTVATTTSDLPATRYRSVAQGPDGNLWIATDAGEIWRVTPR